MKDLSSSGSKKEDTNSKDSLRVTYFQLLNVVERLHRQLLDVIKDELERKDHSDLNSVQALLIFNVGNSELTAGELRSRGHYLGSNVSYNLRKLVESGYLCHKRSESDRRSVRVSLTDKGHAIRDILSDLFQRQLSALGPVVNIKESDLKSSNAVLTNLERYWTDHIRFRL